MRKLHRSPAVGALAVPLALAAPGVALAAPGDGVAQNQVVDQAAEQLQDAATGQDNTNVSPVTQVNPAVNAQDIAGLGSFFDEGESDQGIEQDSSIDSSTEQGNSSRTDQDQELGQFSRGGEQSSDFAGGSFR
jgi:hypothetical protein